jgi:hypothetical protein
MRHQHQHPATAAILGSNTLGEHVLAMLFEDEGYGSRLLKAPPSAATTTLLLPEDGSVEGLLEGVDVVLLWPAPTPRDDAREAFVGAMRSACARAKIPVLALSPSMVVASNDELAGEGPFMRHFEQLIGIIRKVLGSPAGSVSFLDLGGGCRMRGGACPLRIATGAAILAMLRQSASLCD